MRPETTIFNAKRFIGGDLNDSATQSYASAHPYRVVPCALSKHSKVGFELSGYESSKTADASAVSAVHKIVTPENVGTEVRHHYMTRSTSFFGAVSVPSAIAGYPTDSLTHSLDAANAPAAPHSQLIDNSVRSFDTC